MFYNLKIDLVKTKDAISLTNLSNFNKTEVLLLESLNVIIKDANFDWNVELLELWAKMFNSVKDWFSELLLPSVEFKLLRNIVLGEYWIDISGVLDNSVWTTFSIIETFWTIKVSTLESKIGTCLLCFSRHLLELLVKLLLGLYACFGMFIEFTDGKSKIKKQLNLILLNAEIIVFLSY